MTTQQAADLHPFVIPIRIVNPSYYPDLSLTTLVSHEPCNFVVANDDNIYTTKVIDHSLTIIRLQRQDYHQNYFAETAAKDHLTLTGSQDTSFSPLLNYCHFDNKLYLLYNDTSSSYIVNQYNLALTGNNDLTLNWSNNVPVLGNQKGFLITDSSLYTYSYIKQNNTIPIYYHNQLTSDNGLHKTITGINNVNQIQLHLGYDYDTIYITNKTSVLNVQTAMLNGSDSKLTALQQISSNLGGVLPAVNTLEDDVVSVIYGFNNDQNNIIHISNYNGILNNNGDIVSLDTPLNYNINKLALYDEELNPEQSNLIIASTRNIYNPNFLYIAYISGNDQIRLIKLYYTRQINKTYEKYVPLIMWSTRLDAINDYYYSNGGLWLTSDSKGRIHIFARTQSGQINMWIAEEYGIDLGHTEGTVTQPADTIPLMLSNLETDYTISSHIGFNVPGFPLVNDVIISQVTDDGDNTRIRLEYLNFDELSLYPTLMTELINDVKNAFTTLYQNSNFNVFNVDQLDVPTGADHYLELILPKGSILRPCVVRGSEVITCDYNGKNIKLVMIEHIKDNDYIVNQNGQAVKVIKHLISKIWCQSHNAPFLIPENFFGENRPYNKLLISGDHGIMLNYGVSKPTVVYPQNIKVLRQVLIGNCVEYHHLLLDKHESNFFIANGLEVDSLHPENYLIRK